MQGSWCPKLLKMTHHMHPGIKNTWRYYWMNMAGTVNNGPNCPTARQWRQQWCWQGGAQMLNCTNLGYIVCKVLGEEHINTTAFWDVTSCSMIDKYQMSGETYCLYYSLALEKVVQSFKMVICIYHTIRCHMPNKHAQSNTFSIHTSFSNFNVLL
jgi:hypothetical protein